MVTLLEPSPGGLNMQILARRRVLVVDDNAHARAFLAQILGAVGVDVLQADSGPKALVMLGAMQVDAVFVDMFMQPMDGIQLTRAIRASGQAQIARLPIIMASAQASREVVHGGVVAGVTAFLAKPFSAEGALKRLVGALQPAPVEITQPAPEPAAEDPASRDAAYL